jgi:hypothetical protein
MWAEGPALRPALSSTWKNKRGLTQRREGAKGERGNHGDTEGTEDACQDTAEDAEDAEEGFG